MSGAPQPPPRATPVPHDFSALAFPSDFTRRATKLQCVNMVCNFKMTGQTAGMRIRVTELSRKLPGVAYNPQRFAACQLRCDQATALIFDGGSAVCVGTTSEQQARISALRFTNFLLRTGELVAFRDFAVQNVVCRGAAGFLVDIAAVDKAYPIDASYDAGTFPGLIFRLKPPRRTTIIVFVSGYCIVTGNKNMAEAELIWAWFYTAVLLPFRLDAAVCPTSSAYRVATLAAQDTVAADCDALWRQYTAAQQQQQQPQQPQAASVEERYVTDDADEKATEAAAEAAYTRALREALASQGTQ